MRVAGGEPVAQRPGWFDHGDLDLITQHGADAVDGPAAVGAEIEDVGVRGQAEVAERVEVVLVGPVQRPRDPLASVPP